MYGISRRDLKKVINKLTVRERLIYRHLFFINRFFDQFEIDVSVSIIEIPKCPVLY